ncbi:Hypothetical predicted protein [Mytilus galloprovincialis]|uniref:Uncharacterized protein n=1 Tax=Mytilus galloprovincialis TaxID=29158 RepID=A0A8B6HUE8_MYTGA|nr:Hypothetical predicted protein [Mytilus galloprovincialis]
MDNKTNESNNLQTENVKSPEEKYEDREAKSTSETNLELSKDRSLTFDSPESTQRSSKICIRYHKAAPSSEMEMKQLKSTMTTEDDAKKRTEHDTVILIPQTA